MSAANASQMAASTNSRGQSFDAIYPGTSQVVAVGAASVQSTAMGAKTTVVQLVSTVACFVKFAANPTAAANTSSYLPPNVPVNYAVNPGDKIAAIQAVGAGSLYITEGA